MKMMIVTDVTQMITKIETVTIKMIRQMEETKKMVLKKKVMVKQAAAI